MNVISSKTAQQIVDTVKEFCGYDINFINEKGMILASTDTLRIGTFHEGGMAALKNGESLEVFQDDAFHGTQKGVNIPVLQDGKPSAVIGISGNPDEVRSYARLAERITRLILREQELNAAARTSTERKNYLIQSLLNGSPENPGYLLRLLKDFGLDPDSPKKIILIRLNSKNSSGSISYAESRIQKLCDTLQGTVFCYQYPCDFILLADASCIEQHFSFLEHFASQEQNVLCIGVGKSVDLYQAQASYATAQIALESLSLSETNLSRFDQLTLEILLGSVSLDGRQEFLARSIGSLSSDDKHLLRMYFEEDCSLSHTAEKLFLHKNTLQYRLDRIRRNSGYDPRKFKDGVILYLALRLSSSAP